MHFFLKPEAGWAVSDHLEERLKRLQQQVEESKQSCEGLSGEVESFTKATKEMCRRAGRTFGAFGAALDVEYARLEESKRETSSGGVGSGLKTALAQVSENVTKRRLSGAPRTSTEPLRSELLAMQLAECANEMVDDLRVQVLQPMERVLASRGDIQIAIRERTRAADTLAAAHKDVARAVARYEPATPRIANGDQGKLPAAEMMLLADRVAEASGSFAEAHGRAEEVLSGILEERGRCLREAMASLKAAQTVFFVRAGHCVSSSVGQTPPPEMADNANDLVTEDNSGDDKMGGAVSMIPLPKSAELVDFRHVKKQTSVVSNPTATTKVDSIDKAATLNPAGPLSHDVRNLTSVKIATDVPVLDSVEEAPGVGASAAPRAPLSSLIGGFAAAPTEEQAAPVEGGAEPPRPSCSAEGSDTGDGKAGETGGSTRNFGAFGSPKAGTNKVAGSGIKNGGLNGSGVTLSDAKRKRTSGWLRRISMSFKTGQSKSRSSSDDWEGSLTPLSRSAGAVGEEIGEMLSGNMAAVAATWPPPDSLVHDFAIACVGGRDAPATAFDGDVRSKTQEERGVDVMLSAVDGGDQTSEGDAEVEGGSEVNAIEAGATEGSVGDDGDEVRRNIYVSLFADFAARSHSEDEDGEREQDDVFVDSAEAQRLALAETLKTGASHAGQGMLARDLPVANAGERSEESDSDETGSNSTEGFGPETAGTLFDGSGGRESVLFPRSPIIFGTSGSAWGGDVARPEGTENGDGDGDDGGCSCGDGGDAKMVGGMATLTDVPEAIEGEEGEGGDIVEEREELLGSTESLKQQGMGAAEEKQTPFPVAESERDDPLPMTVAKVDTVRLAHYGDEEETTIDPPSTPPNVSMRPRPHIERPPALASVLPCTPDNSTTMESPISRTAEAMVTPNGGQTSLATPKDMSPTVSEESSTRGTPRSPRSWRLSGWWARASDRHRPPPPGGDENDFPGVGNSLAASLAAAAAGGDAVTPTPAAGGGVSAAGAGSGGDGRPAVADDVIEGLGEKGASSTVGTLLEEQAAASAAEAVAEEKRAWSQSRRRRLATSWLSADRLVDHSARPFEAAREFLDVTELSRVCGVCRGWAERLGGEGGGREWRRCVRLAGGVPESWRARFYLHVLYDQPSWLPKGHERRRITSPRQDLYRKCLLEAETEDEARRTAAAAAESWDEEREGVDRADSQRRREGLLQAPGDDYGRAFSPPPVAKCYKWLEEIDTDVLRTCPADAKTISNEIRTPTTGTAAHDGPNTGGIVDSGPGIKGKAVAGTEWLVTDASPPSWMTVLGRKKEDQEREEGRGIGKAPSDAGGPVAEESAEDSTGMIMWSGSPTGGGTRDKLRRVLRAFAVHNRRVSYCQGMNFVALALLDACCGDDEQAFWILSGMCDRLELEGLWCQGLERLDFCFFALDRLLEHHCPSLRQHLADEGVQLNMFTSRWFVTLFACNDVFGRGTSRKILDMFLVERWPIIFKVSLGVLLEMRPLLEPADMEGILKITKFPRAQLFGLRRDGTGRHVVGATFEEAAQGSLCESIRAGQIVDHALRLYATEETLERYLTDYRGQEVELEPGSD